MRHIVVFPLIQNISIHVITASISILTTKYVLSPQPVTDLLLKGAQVTNSCITSLPYHALEMPHKLGPIQATHFCAKHMMAGTPVGDAFK